MPFVPIKTDDQRRAFNLDPKNGLQAGFESRHLRGVVLVIAGVSGESELHRSVANHSVMQYFFALQKPDRLRNEPQRCAF
jgi:hypothetical protein